MLPLRPVGNQHRALTKRLDPLGSLANKLNVAARVAIVHDDMGQFAIGDIVSDAPAVSSQMSLRLGQPAQTSAKPTSGCNDLPVESVLRGLG